MRRPAPNDLLARAESWEDLSRWERAELGRALRVLGWSYAEIRETIPVPKATLSGWCSGIQLRQDQIEAIRERTAGVAGVPRDTQWRRRLEIQAIRTEAAAEVAELIREPLWVAGTTMYWAEGAKTSNRLSLANSDARALRLFIDWVDAFLFRDAQLVLKLNVHFDNDEPAARSYWAEQLGLPGAYFYKTFVKPEGTGHRKNHLSFGVCEVRVRKSTDAFHRTMAWIDNLSGFLSRDDC